MAAARYAEGTDVDVTTALETRTVPPMLLALEAGPS